MPPDFLQWIPPTIIVGFILYLHRVTRQDIKGVRGEITDLRGEITDLRIQVDTGIEKLGNRMGRVEERMAHLEGTLDVLREFFVRKGRGNAA